MINKTEYRERISALKDEVLKLNIDDVIEVFLSKRPDRRDMVNNPSEDGFLCPFHDDHNSNGKFTYVNKKGVGMFKCFVCGTGGNAIDFVVNLNKVGFVEAVLDIAVNFSIITKEEYKVLTNKEFTDKQVEGERKPSYRPFAPLRDTRVTNIVYYLLSQGPSLMDKNAGHLSEEDLSYLHGRGITDKEIVTYGYFTMPNEDCLPYLFDLLPNYGLSKDDLIGIPGFYREKATGNIRLVVMNGIGIPIRNLIGAITAIQVRARGEVLKGSRYKFLSSSFVAKEKYKDIFEGGCKPEEITSFVQPPKNAETPFDPKVLCITEGQFKAAQFSMAKNTWSISVQGVNNTKAVVPMLEELCKVKHIEKDKLMITLAFDMDMYQNIYVFAAAIKLRAALEKAGWNVFYAVWNPKYKGLDDFLIAKANGETNGNIVAKKAKKFEDATFVDLINTILGAKDPNFQNAEYAEGQLVLHYKDRDKATKVTDALSYNHLLRQAMSGRII